MNLEAIAFLQELNTVVHAEHPGVLMVAEESTAWPGVTRPVHHGGLGFGLKWNMGFMHDTLAYFGRDPVHRRHHHADLTRPMLWAHAEQHVLPVSHDEVVHGKGSLYGRMPGDDWQRRANVRAYLAWMWAHPGRPLVFMGCETAQHAEWDHDREVDWAGADAGVQALVADLNAIYRARPALHATDDDPAAFAWLVVDAAEENVAAFARHRAGDLVVCVANLSPVVRERYRLALGPGVYDVLLNTDAGVYGGSGVGPGATVEGPDPVLVLPPLGLLLLAPQDPSTSR